MLSFAIAVVLMLALVGGSMQWALRKQRRIQSEESHAGLDR